MTAVKVMYAHWNPAALALAADAKVEEAPRPKKKNVVLFVCMFV